ncbi:IclR family transcriptional regulator domain-containing protein [Thalassobius sp. S69A]|uniref:IclR family transcriptional regulator domain-containing protein n=1 Tax=unclassified Thalassovita TaxID=2619711 RepID=UPI000C0F4121|nr:IclR family transcriptional regulator [Paracoccaceae bacterium]MBT27136.1 IclR family transcriptional regulator [Paracoccaceae bacterium]
MTNKPTDTIASLLKGLQVLECFDGQTARLTISDVAGQTGFDRATARRCLLTLHHGGYANYDGKFFSLTPRALRLGLGALSAMPLPQIVQPWLDQLAEQIGQSCSVSILDGTEIIYIARAAQKRVMSIGLMPGSRLPAHCTSMGRVLLASLPAEQARAVLDASDLSPRTPRTLSDPDTIMERLAQIRADGYSVNDQEIEMGLRSLAVPLVDAKNRTVAALNTGMAAAEDPSTLVRDFLPPLLSVQTGLSRIL